MSHVNNNTRDVCVCVSKENVLFSNYTHIKIYYNIDILLRTSTVLARYTPNVSNNNNQRWHFDGNGYLRILCRRFFGANEVGLFQTRILYICIHEYIIHNV